MVHVLAGWHGSLHFLRRRHQPLMEIDSVGSSMSGQQPDIVPFLIQGLGSPRLVAALCAPVPRPGQGYQFTLAVSVYWGWRGDRRWRSTTTSFVCP